MKHFLDKSHHNKYPNSTTKLPCNQGLTLTLDDSKAPLSLFVNSGLIEKMSGLEKHFFM